MRSNRNRPFLVSILIARVLIANSLGGQSYWTRHTIGGGGSESAIAVDPRDSDVVYATTDLGGIIKTTNGGKEWLAVNNNIGNSNLYDIELDPLNPDTVYVLASLQRVRVTWTKTPPNGELYRSRDAGHSWENLWSEGANGRRSFGIRSSEQVPNLLILHDPSNPGQYDRDGDRLSDVILVGGIDDFKGEATDVRSGIWRSVDEGTTFEQIALERLSIACLYQDPRDPATVWAGTYAHGLWRSDDHGQTWRPCANELARSTVLDVKRKPESNVLFASTNKGIYRSTEDGSSFEKVEITSVYKTFTEYMSKTLIFDNRDKTHNTIFAGIDREKSWIKIIRSTDGGTTWKKTNVELNPEIAWFRHGIGGRINDFQQAPDGALYVSTWRGVRRYDPTSDTWEIRSKGIGNIVINRVRFDPRDPSIFYLGMADSGPYKSFDRGKTWQFIGEGFTFPDKPQSHLQATQWAIAETHPDLVYACGYMGSGGKTYACRVFKSEDAGQTWTGIMNGLPATGWQPGQGTWRTRGLAVDPADPNIVYAALEMKKGGGRIYRTVNGGKSWEQVHKMGNPYAGLAVCRKNGLVACAGSDKVVHISRNRGKDWEESAVIAKDLMQIYAIDISPTDPNRICIGVNLQGAHLSKDGGKTWTHILKQSDFAPFLANLAVSDRVRENYPATIKAVRFDPTNPDTLYVGHSPGGPMGVGILKTTDSGRTWSPFSDPKLFLNKIRTIDIDPKGQNVVAAGLEAYYYHYSGQ
ncbi:MAG: hypothetical protein JXR37_04175 [Kiritimatiellae bacterium]|nr:hypothetical protein [Kiritimatiellia bacterium]